MLPSVEHSAIAVSTVDQLRSRVWVSVEAGVLSVESIVDRLLPHVWVSVIAALLPVNSS